LWLLIGSSIYATVGQPHIKGKVNLQSVDEVTMRSINELVIKRRGSSGIEKFDIYGGSSVDRNECSGRSGESLNKLGFKSF